MKKRVYVQGFFWRQQLRHVHYILAGAFCLKQFVVHLFLVQKFAHNLDYIFQKTDWKMSELIKNYDLLHIEKDEEPVCIFMAFDVSRLRFNRVHTILAWDFCHD